MTSDSLSDTADVANPEKHYYKGKRNVNREKTNSHHERCADQAKLRSGNITVRLYADEKMVSCAAIKHTEMVSVLLYRKG